MLSPPPTPLSHAHMSDYASKMIVPRHQDSLGSTIEFPVPSNSVSPRGSNTTTAVNSRRGSYDNLLANLPVLQRSSGPDITEKKETFERMKWRLAAGYFAYFMCGWENGITGTVLPFFMADFHLSFTTSSLLFAGTTCGFLSGTLLVEALMRVLSRAHVTQTQSAWFPYLSFPRFKTTTRRRANQDGIRSSFIQAQHLSLIIATLLHTSFFIMMGTRSSYATTFVAYVVAAIARAILTGANLYFNTVMPQSLSYAYGLWSFGGVISPLICQSLVAAGIPWNQFYFGSLVLCAFYSGFLTLAFRPTATEWIRECQKDAKESKKRSSEEFGRMSPSSDKLERPISPVREEAKPQQAQQSALRRAISLGIQWAFSFFSLMYCGCETTTQGFMVSYLLGTRNANPKTVGYVTSGFWAGISIGRFAWGYYMPSLNFTQRKLLVQACLTVGLIIELLIWFVNSNIGNAFSASVIGLVFGPIYPASLSLATAILPQEIHMVSMALIGAAGSVGSAIFPFVAGVISSSKGVYTLTYITVGLAGSLFSMWFLFPSRVPVATR
ncbi:MFS general substrate transporter [Macrolepiota fuliginosa MF-IS2]|uniref:MFS general substrate transporter n=1 Tax=Macrolepiota fuliginosa MF-IS2 TaxID=1400762 RepID=A0A9P5XME2_9AGAR|nr:MFS general substrate transporter [Macrolepiota fuliginosa MF-IS2]